MPDKRITFSGPMVRALIQGRKTQTRRVLKPQPVRTYSKGKPYGWASPLWPDGASGYPEAIFGKKVCNGSFPEVVSVSPGDRLWVQEECALTQFGKPVYRADARDADGNFWSSITPGDPDGEVLWGPAKMMERKHSRITLTVTDVRVQRVQEISEGDAIAEGCRGYVSADGEDGESPVEQFQDLWNSIHGPDAWAANPWVVAYSFTVQQRNIDAETPDA